MAPIASALTSCDIARPPDTSSAMPAAPTPMPMTTRRLGGLPPGRAQSSSAMCSGTPATSSAVRFDGTCFSAKVTRPLPPVSMSSPAIAA